MRITTSGGVEYEHGYSFEVITPSGRQSSPKAITHTGGPSGVYDIGPGKSKDFTLHLSTICRFDEIGNYTVTIKRAVVWPHNASNYFTVVSNPLTIKIVPVGNQ